MNQERTKPISHDNHNTRFLRTEGFSGWTFSGSIDKGYLELQPVDSHSEDAVKAKARKSRYQDALDHYVGKLNGKKHEAVMLLLPTGDWGWELATIDKTDLETNTYQLAMDAYRALLGGHSGVLNMKIDAFRVKKSLEKKTGEETRPHVRLVKPNGNSSDNNRVQNTPEDPISIFRKNRLATWFGKYHMALKCLVDANTNTTIFKRAHIYKAFTDLASNC